MLQWTRPPVMGVLLASLWSSFVIAAGPELSLGTVSGAPGGSVGVDVGYVSDGTVVAMNFQVAYDPAVVTPSSTPDTNGIMTFSKATDPYDVLGKCDAAAKLCKVVAMAKLAMANPESPTAAEDTANAGKVKTVLASNTELATIPFKIAENAVAAKLLLGVTGVVMSNAAAPPAAVTPAKVTNGAIDIAVVPGDVDGDGKLELADLRQVITAYFSGGSVPSCNGAVKPPSLAEVRKMIKMFFSGTTVCQ